MNKNFICIVALMILTACAGGGEQQAVSLQNPFVGGNEGVSIDFQNLRDVFDGGRDPFDVVVKVTNKGESAVAKNKIRVKLSGFNPAEFGKLEEQLSKSADEDLIAVKKDAQGNILAGNPSFVEFKDLNHFSPIAGALQSVDIVANVCYNYKTLAVSKLCVRSNILNPVPGGLCEINGNKEIFNSGAPVQVSNLIESTGGKDKVSFVFEVLRSGAGSVFEKDSFCDRSSKSKENKVYVKINTKLNGLTCSGLNSQGSTAEGFVTLFEDTGVMKRQISCTQQIASKSDFEQVIQIEANYDYEDFKRDKINIKSSGE